ncbi:mCG148475 [Mus musculus]|uniref:Uncharacterized protein n=1 Tax=Mus musculus TaxID=10090 RepID=Q9DA30_MOUSE|nr:mCG148475 [Mus musculus]BAB24470.1 unnamed protein product [Mus musculus]
MESRSLISGQKMDLLQPAPGSYKDTFGENSFIEPDPLPPITGVADERDTYSSQCGYQNTGTTGPKDDGSSPESCAGKRKGTSQRTNFLWRGNFQFRDETKTQKVMRQC